VSEPGTQEFKVGQRWVPKQRADLEIVARDLHGLWRVRLPNGNTALVSESILRADYRLAERT
jgi:hypothetical protein